MFVREWQGPQCPWHTEALQMLGGVATVLTLISANQFRTLFNADKRSSCGKQAQLRNGCMQAAACRPTAHLISLKKSLLQLHLKPSDLMVPTLWSARDSFWDIGQGGRSQERTVCLT